MQAASTPCEGCGAPVSFAVGAETLRCDRCGASQPVEPTLAAALASAVTDYAAAAEAELRARWVAAFYANNERATNLIVLSVVVIAPLVLVWWFLLAIDAMASVPSFVALVLVSLAAVGAFGRGFRIMYEMPSLRALGLVATLRCAGCGGWSAFAAGRATDRCEYCNGHRLVPLTLLREAIDVVRGETVDPLKPTRPKAELRWAGYAIAIPFVIVIVIIPAWVAAELMLLEGLPHWSSWWAIAVVGAFAAVDLVRTVFAVRNAMARREEMEREVSRLILAAAAK